MRGVRMGKVGARNHVLSCKDEYEIAPSCQFVVKLGEILMVFIKFYMDDRRQRLFIIRANVGLKKVAYFILHEIVKGVLFLGGFHIDIEFLLRGGCLC